MIGGGVAEAGDLILEPARAEVRRRMRIAAGGRHRDRPRPSSATRPARSARRCGARRPRVIRTTVIGSYPLPGLARVRGRAPRRVRRRTTSPSCRRTRSIAAVHDQVAAGLDVITDGEQTRLDFNLSFYGYLEGIELEGAPAAPLRAAGARPARAGTASPASSRRRAAWARSPSSSGCGASRRAGPTAEGERARAVHARGRLRARTRDYPDRWALTEALLPIVRDELDALVDGRLRGDQRRRAVDELLRAPRGSASASSRSSTARSSRSSARTRLCDAPLLRQLQGARGRRRGATRRCSRRSSTCTVDEIHVEMASREFAEIEIIGADRRAQRTWRSASST